MLTDWVGLGMVSANLFDLGDRIFQSHIIKIGDRKCWVYHLLP
jgi:hypothetical protein